MSLCCCAERDFTFGPQYFHFITLVLFVFEPWGTRLYKRIHPLSHSVF